MKLMTQEILIKIPPLYSQESKGEDAIVYVKFFTPWSNWTWFATEGCAIILLSDGTQVEKELKNVDQTMFKMWHINHGRKIQEADKYVCEMQESMDIQKQENTSCNNGEEWKLEGRNNDKSGICLCPESGSSQGQQAWVCKESESSLGESNGTLSSAKRIDSSQGREQVERQSGEFRVDDKIRTSEISYIGQSPRQETLIDILFFGLVKGMEDELGYFSLEELESISGPGGLKIERDMYFKPCTLREARNQ